MMQTSASAATNFFKALMFHEIKLIKDKYQDKSLFEEANEELPNPILYDPASEFIEFNIQKHIHYIKMQSQQKKLASTKPVIKEFMT